jgi:TonB-linked SusC/RagA family outer membrane protein
MKKIASILFTAIALLVPFILSAQQKQTVQGTVLDASEQPVPGAVVMLDGSTSSATMTDEKGHYVLEFKMPSSGKASLTVTCIGYADQTVPVNGRSVIDVTLAEDSEQLEESVVVGYGSMRRSDLTGAVTSVKMTDEAASQNNSFDKLLQGRAAGVQVVSNSSAPDAGVSVLIRGASSYNGSTEPLYVVDGVIISSSSNASLLTRGQDNEGSNEASNGLMGISPQDIASIEILKDASATAIYGSQGANGVVLITTKSATRDRPVINFNSGVTVSWRYKKLEMLDFDEYVEYLETKGTAARSYLDIIYKDAATHTGLQVEPKDWQDYVERTAVSQNYHLSIAGRPKNMSYMASFGYTGSEGIVKSTGFDNYVFRLNLDKQVTPKLKIGTKTNFSYLDSRLTQGANASRLTAATSLMRSMFSTKPYRSLHEDDMDELDDVTASGSTFLSGPDRWLTDFENRKEEIRFTPSITIEYKILKYLNFRSTTGADYRSSEQYKWKSARINSTAEGSVGAVAHTRSIYWNTNNMFNFFRKIGDHRINATAGVTLSSSGGSTETVEGWNIAQYKAKIDGINAAPNTSFRYTETDSHLASGLVRLIYSYHDRYVLTSTYRLDGSSKFQGKNKWASFPSFAFAWRVNQERWFRVPVISMLKLRAGWGRVGNQAITSYQTQSTYEFSNYPSHEAGNDAHFSVSMFPTNVANPKLKWETTEQTNLGLDFGMWDGRFTLTADLYYKNTFDLLQNKIIPGSSGYTNMWMNMGSITNKGIELTIDATPLKFGGFEWQIGGNITFNKNRINQIGEGSEGDYIFLSPGVREYRNFFYGNKIGYGSYCNAPLNIFIEGEPMSIFYGYKSAGIVQEGEEGVPVSQGGAVREPGAVQYLDLDGNGYLDDYDRTIIGDPNPKFTYGFNTAFTFRGFTLSANFVGSYGNDIYNVNEVMNTDIATLGVNISRDAYYKAWTPENMSQRYPALGKLEGFDLKVMSDRFVEDGSYLRLANVSFSYDFVFKKNNVIKGLNLGVTGSNLYIWTKYSGFDPDVNSYGSAWRKGADMGSYPGARSVSFNVRLTF